MTGLRVAVDWSDCFILNGPLDSYVLLENGLLIYEGQQNKRDLGNRNVGGKRRYQPRPMSGAGSLVDLDQ